MELEAGRARPRRKRPGHYHHGGLRRALLDASIVIVETDGTGAVSLSAAARKVGVSPQASYNHFRDKQELLAAVAEECVRSLAAAMAKARDAAKHPGERLEATGVAYVAFARAHPARFRLLGTPELADKAAHPHLVAAYELAVGVLIGAIEDAQRAGVVRAGAPRDLAIAAWAEAHGLSSLVADGLLRAISSDDDEPTTRGAFRTLFRGLRADR